MTTVLAFFVSAVFMAALHQFNRNVKAFKVERDRMMAMLHEKQLIIDQERQKVQDAIRHNEYTYKRNATELFHIKESSLMLYYHWDNMADLLSNILYYLDPEDPEAEHEVGSALAAAEDNVGNVTNFFVSNFRMTPREYAEQKVNQKIKFKQVMKRPGGGTFNSEFSLN